MEEDSLEYPNGMRIGELKQLIKDFPDEAEVWVGNLRECNPILSVNVWEPCKVFKTGRIEFNDYSNED